jgi:hypothetical protein
MQTDNKNHTKRDKKKIDEMKRLKWFFWWSSGIYSARADPKKPVAFPD